MGPQFDIDAVLVEERLQAKEIQAGQTLAHDSLMIGAIVAVVVAAVHRPMAIGDDPWTLGAILWPGGHQQIALQPIILHDNRLETELRKIVHLGAEANKVNRSEIEAIEQVIRAARHAESIDIVREIAAPDGADVYQF